jgi:hypothetical protein
MTDFAVGSRIRKTHRCVFDCTLILSHPNSVGSAALKCRHLGSRLEADAIIRREIHGWWLWWLQLCCSV